MNGKPLVYLDNGASAQKPQVVIDAVTRLLPGALGDDNDTYTTKVLSEKQRLQQVVASLAEPSPAAPRLVQRVRVAHRGDSPLGE